MKVITEAEWSELMAIRALVSGSAADLLVAAHALVNESIRQGVVLTIEQRALKPLAMGNYESVVSVRSARPQAGAR